ncbi:MAG TPA: SNF2-related protein, partial [Solirubrobacteraceae bacterium]|nr:SNF2-related protein [Solirubrobacteraceae bacterium]
MIGAISELDIVELSEVEEVVGSRSFERGRSYARRNRVAGIKWDRDAETLTGSVVGQGALYKTTAFFAADGDGGVAFEEGECSCPVGYNCKHVAAIVIVATASPGVDRRKAAAGAPRKAAAAAAPRPSWEQPLRLLIGAPDAQSTGTPLAIELGLQANGSAFQRSPRLVARLMRPAARGGWVNGSLAWSGLDSWQVQNGGHRPEHIALMRELYAIRHARERASAFSYRPAGDRTLDLGGCESAQLWSLLDEADRLGLAIVHAQPGLGDVPPYLRGELAMDVRRRSEASVVSAAIRVDGANDRPLQPVLFLGSSGHGVVCVEPGEASAGDDLERRRLQLVRLAKPAPAQLRRMVLDGDQLEIPAGDLDRFAEEFFPALRHLATIVSSDGSFKGPEISAPTLVLRLDYGADHGVEAGWEWRYQVGSTTRRAAVSANGGPAGFRDLEAERGILTGAVLTETGLGGFGLLDPAGRPSGGPAVSLTGIDAMRLTTEALPLLAQRDDVAVDVAGATPDYRDVGESLTIGVSTADVAGDRDWFDLGVTISVEGHELPFADVFTALAGGESRMMLEDGAHFSLLEPRLQSLRQLIDEARSLSDSPSAPLRISRYQAGLWTELVALGVVTEQAAAWQRQASALLELDAVAEYDPPSTLTARLRPYQREGFCWLASLWELELGGILADDMGLGKTLQALALICHARDRDPEIGAFLVVAPTSVVSNWVSEAGRFAPALRVAAITDTMAKSGRTLDEILAGADVVVTTYTLLRLEADSYRTVTWAGLMLDEAQYVKNHQSSTYHAIRQLEAPFKVAITGTPMENNLMELWSLLSITAPGLFPDPGRFREYYAKPVEKNGQADLLAQLRRRIRPLVRRRTKEQVAADL